MAVSDQPNDHLIRNPNDVNYQPYGGALYLNEPIIDLGPCVENIKQGLKNWWEELKENVQQNVYNIQNPLIAQPNDHLITNPETVNFQIPNSNVLRYSLSTSDLTPQSPAIDPLYYTVNDQGMVFPKQLPQQEYRDPNSIIHEELAEKTKEINNLKEQVSGLSDKVEKLQSKIKKFEKERKLLGWFNRAVEDSKDEKIF